MSRALLALSTLKQGQKGCGTTFDDRGVLHAPLMALRREPVSGQCPIGAAAPSLTLRKESASGTATSATTVSTQKASM
jgi:hypothetical protein